VERFETYQLTNAVVLDCQLSLIFKLVCWRLFRLAHLRIWLVKTAFERAERWTSDALLKACFVLLSDCDLALGVVEVVNRSQILLKPAVAVDQLQGITVFICSQNAFHAASVVVLIELCHLIICGGQG